MIFFCLVAILVFRPLKKKHFFYVTSLNNVKNVIVKDGTWHKVYEAVQYIVHKVQYLSD